MSSVSVNFFVTYFISALFQIGLMSISSCIFLEGSHFLKRESPYKRKEIGLVSCNIA